MTCCFKSFRNLAILKLLVAFGVLYPRGGEAAFLSAGLTGVSAGSNVVLTTEGNLDWVHWGFRSDSSINRKSTVAPKISDFTFSTSASNFNQTYAYQFTDNANGYSWSDGYPVREATNTTTGIWAYNFAPPDSGFLLTVPADTTIKTLRLYVGAYDARGRLEASLSDGSASGITNNQLFHIGNGNAGVFTVSFGAASSNQTLSIKWVVDTPLGQNANVTLQAATLSVSGSNNPPFVSLTNPAPYANYTFLSQIPLTAKPTDVDGSIYKVDFYDRTNIISQSFGPNYTFSWSSASVGLHTVTARVTDNLGLVSTSRPVNIFVYTNGGSLSGSLTTPPAVDLTTEGTRDWAHWGLINSNSYNRKNLTAPILTGLTPIGSNSFRRMVDYATPFTWSDGTPTTSAYNITNGVFIIGFDNGFELVAPADSDPRILRLYVGVYGGQGTLFAYLSDGSAPSYNDSTLSSDYGNSAGVYTLNYTATHPGQTLRVRYTTTGIFDMDFGNVAIAAATLVGGPSPLVLLEPTWTPAEFSFAFFTDPNRSYTAQFCDSLSSTNWQTFTNLPGTGDTVRVTNANENAGERFYRVTAQP